MTKKMNSQTNKPLKHTDIAIIGGGAAGFFSAITAKINQPTANVVIFEKSKNVLSKVKISGGGRCNVTNGCGTINELANAYPRGKNSLKKAFNIFSNKDAMEWFESKGVPLIIQDDGCVFPSSQNSQSIIDCFITQAKILNINIRTKSSVNNIKENNSRLEIFFKDKECQPVMFDKIIVTTGGSPKRKGLDWLEELGHKIESPVPSLFTFNMPSESITKLMGIVVDQALVTIQGTKFKSEGPLLITHWGMSGPAILKLSAFGARLLSEKIYDFKIQVNWCNIPNHKIVMSDLKQITHKHSNKILSNIRPYFLPERLWHYLLDKCDISLNKRWSEVGKKNLNKLVGVITNDIYTVNGKTTFKEEFVTCGGISLDNIDINTMQSRIIKNLYFAGEILDIDGITGGYNFQAAWTTAFIAGKLN